MTTATATYETLKANPSPRKFYTRDLNRAYRAMRAEQETDCSGDLCHLCGTFTLNVNLVDAVCAYCRQRQSWEAKCNEAANV